MPEPPPGAEAAEQALTDALELIPKLRTTLAFPRSVSPPVAVISYPEVDFDLTAGRGGDTLRWEVTLVVSKASERAARQTLMQFLRPSGSHSVKAAVEGFATTAVDFFRVVRARQAQEFTFDNINYLGCVFDVEAVVSWR